MAHRPLGNGAAVRHDRLPRVDLVARTRALRALVWGKWERVAGLMGGEGGAFRATLPHGAVGGVRAQANRERRRATALRVGLAAIGVVALLVVSLLLATPDAPAPASGLAVDQPRASATDAGATSRSAAPGASAAGGTTGTDSAGGAAVVAPGVPIADPVASRAQEPKVVRVADGTGAAGAKRVVTVEPDRRVAAPATAGEATVAAAVPPATAPAAAPADPGASATPGSPTEAAQTPPAEVAVSGADPETGGVRGVIAAATGALRGRVAPSEPAVALPTPAPGTPPAPAPTPSTPPAPLAPAGVRVEAEAGTLSGPLAVEAAEGASGGLAIGVPEGGPEEGTAQMVLDVPADGTYVLWGRVQAPDDGSNSFFASLDGGSETPWDLPSGPSWSWQGVKTEAAREPVAYWLRAGQHRVDVRARENGTLLDTLVLLPRGAAAPG